MSVPVGCDAFAYHLRAVPEQLRPARRAITRWAAGAGLARERVHDVALAVGEALTNSIEHAYPRDLPGPIWVDAQLSGGQVRVVVRDRGQWRPPGSPGWRGRGLALIREITDRADLAHDQGATVITMVWDLEVSRTTVID